MARNRGNSVSRDRFLTQRTQSKQRNAEETRLRTGTSLTKAKAQARKERAQAGRKMGAERFLTAKNAKDC